MAPISRIVTFGLLGAAVNLVNAVAVKRAGASGSGKTTRYWDCCKPSCAWPRDGITSPVKTCDIKDKPLSDVNAQSGCTGGPSFMCSDQSPWAVNDNLAYGFAAVTASNPTCCQCYKLTFTSTAIKGKTMIVQATNTGTDVSSAQFDLAMPGGGFGMFDACTKEWNATPAVWGDQYGGMHSNQCSKIPEPVQPGCNFRWNWMQGADNPTVDYETVDCPAEIVAKTGCSITGSKASTPIVPSSIQDSTPSGTSSVIVNPGPTSAAEVPVSNISNREPTAPTSVSMSTSEPAQGTGGAGEGEEDDDTCVS